MNAINLKIVRYSYPDGTHALRKINLKVPVGQSIAILGPNGSGKSTFAMHLNGAIENKESEINIMGLKLNKENLTEIRSRVGLVFQDPDDQLFCPTVFDDVAFGPINMGFSPEETEKIAMRAMKKAGVLHLKDSSPQHLSVGEKKRISIATVLAMDSEILVLDEPTANMDGRGKRELAELLKQLPQTKVIATHDLDFAGWLTQRSIILHKGRIVEDEPTKKLLKDKKLLYDYGLL